MRRAAFASLALVACLACGPGARAQQLDLTRGGPIEITASDGLEWHQNEQQVVARGNARAVRGNVTVTADRLIAYYRKKPGTGTPAATTRPAPPAPTPIAVAPAPTPAGAAVGSPGGTPGGTPGGASGGTPPSGKPARVRTAAAPASAQPGILGGGDSGSNEIYRVEAIGNVHIFTATDQVWGARAIYDMDQSVMLMTGGNLKLTTPTQVLTARDSLEYWTQRRMAVARGNAVVVTNDAKRVSADTLVAFTKEDSAAAGPRRAAPAPAAPVATNPQGQTPGALQQAGSGKLQRVEAFGHVNIQTPTEVVTGDRGIYVADTGLARLGGNVRITRGQNQLNGSDAEVNLNTGVSRLLAGNTGRVAGLVVPNDPSNQTTPDGMQPGAAAPPAPARPGRRRPAATAGAPAAAPTGTQP